MIQSNDCLALVISVMQLCALRFYRAMHFSAKRGIAIACRLAVRL